MSKHILAVFGATGQQGGGLINYILSDPALSAKFSLRAIVRDTNSPKATALSAKGVDLAQADASNPSTLVPALSGAQTVFIMTPPAFGPTGFDTELSTAKAMADASVAAGVKYIIFSTLPSFTAISKGKYTKVAAFDAKAAAEAYIRTLPVKSAFVSLGSFMENFHAPGVFLKRTTADGTVVLGRHESPKTKFPLIAIGSDIGKFVGAILAEQDKYAGKRLCAANEIYTWEEKVAILSKVTGKKVVYEQVPEEEYRKSLPAAAADVFIEGFSTYELFGYYGPETEELVAWAREQARGRLTTFEEYLREHPVEF